MKNIEESFKETAKSNEEDVIRVYEAANIEIPDMVKKTSMKFLNFIENKYRPEIFA